MKIPVEGEVLKYRRTGQNFEVKKITADFVILYSRNGALQVMTGKNSVFSSFEELSPAGAPRSN